jgi:hypothetical protein
VSVHLLRAFFAPGRNHHGGHFGANEDAINAMWRNLSLHTDEELAALAKAARDFAGYCDDTVRERVIRTMTDDEIVCGVAQRLLADGLPATAEHTGGGIWCVLIDDDEGGQWYWGMANATWGAQRIAANGDCTDDLLDTTVSSDSEDLDAIAKAIYAAQVGQ